MKALSENDGELYIEREMWRIASEEKVWQGISFLFEIIIYNQHISCAGVPIKPAADIWLLADGYKCMIARRRRIKCSKANGEVSNLKRHHRPKFFAACLLSLDINPVSSRIIKRIRLPESALPGARPLRRGSRIRTRREARGSGNRVCVRLRFRVMLWLN